MIRNNINFKSHALMSCPHNKCVALKCKHILMSSSILVNHVVLKIFFRILGVFFYPKIFLLFNGNKSRSTSTFIWLFLWALEGWLTSNLIFTSWWASSWLTNIWYNCLNLWSDLSIAGKKVEFHSLISGTFYWMWQTNKESHFRVEVRGQSWW